MYSISNWQLTYWSIDLHKISNCVDFLIVKGSSIILYKQKNSKVTSKLTNWNEYKLFRATRDIPVRAISISYLREVAAAVK